MRGVFVLRALEFSLFSGYTLILKMEVWYEEVWTISSSGSGCCDVCGACFCRLRLRQAKLHMLKTVPTAVRIMRESMRIGIPVGSRLHSDMVHAKAMREAVQSMREAVLDLQQII